MNIEFLEGCRERCIQDLKENIMPFWLKNGADYIHGGVYTALDRQGKLMDTTKSVWFQGRFAFVCSYAYNHIEKNEEWLQAARNTLDFIEAHCFDKDGHMFFLVTEDGAPIQKRRYVFSECFAAIAMAEYSKATGDRLYAGKALDIFKNTLRMMETEGMLEPKFRFESRGHSLTMMLINIALVIRQVSDDPILEQSIWKSLQELKDYFMHPEYKTILETVGPEGEFIDTMIGRTINPGHCMETGWFILDAARAFGNDPELIKMGCQVIDWAWDWGWDEPYGGMINFRDCRNFPPQDYSQDMKFWWPQCETIIASLYAYNATGNAKYLDMHRKAFEYAFGTFSDPQFGEWYGYLHRDGTVAQDAKGNMFKGPFHIPRMMVKATLEYDKILNNLKKS